MAQDPAAAQLVHEDTSMLSWRYCLPTAWIHLLVVECMHIYLSVLSWHSLVTNIEAHYMEIQYDLNTAAINQYVSDLLFFGGTGEARIGGHDTVLVWPKWQFKGLDYGWLGICWILPLGACALLLFVLAGFVAGGFWSFEEAGYLQFTWSLPRQRPYHLCIAFMAVGPIVLPIFWLWNVIMYTQGDDFAVNLLLMKRSALSILFLLFNLNLLAFPATPVHNWKACPDFLALRFRRPLLSLLLSPNASFGMKLMDALWTAQHGDVSRLARYVSDPGATERVLEICHRAQQAEVRARKEPPQESELAKLHREESSSSSEADCTARGPLGR